MEDTVHNDAIGGRLAEAMMLLEMVMDGCPFHAQEMLAATHSIVQAACFTYTSGKKHDINQQAKEILAAIAATAAIEEAKEPRP